MMIMKPNMTKVIKKQRQINFTMTLSKVPSNGSAKPISNMVIWYHSLRIWSWLSDTSQLYTRHKPMMVVLKVTGM